MTIEAFTPRFRRYLSSIFLGRGGAGGSVLTVLDDVMPTINVVDPGQQEYHLSRDERVWSMAGVQSGGAGRFATMSIWPMANNPTMVCVERILVSGNSAPGSILCYITRPGPLAQVLGAIPTDTRDVGALNALNADVGTSQADLAALPVTAACLQVGLGAANTAPIDLLDPDSAIILTPGYRLQVCFSVAAGAFIATAWGYMRTVEPQELI